MKKERLENNILDAIEVLCSIQCTKCKHTERMYGADSYDLVDTLISDGWYATDKNVYCPKCNEDRISKKKKK